MSSIGRFLLGCFRWVLAVIRIPCPGAVRPVGQLGHLLFESPVELGAAGVGGDLCGNLDLGSLVFAQAIRVLCGNRVLSGGGRVVDFHFPVTLSQLAPGSGGHAASYHRWRPRSPDWRAELRLPERNDFR